MDPHKEAEDMALGLTDGKGSNQTALQSDMTCPDHDPQPRHEDGVNSTEDSILCPTTSPECAWHKSYPESVCDGVESTDDRICRATQKEDRSTDTAVQTDTVEVAEVRTYDYELAMGEDIYGLESSLHTGQVGQSCPKNPGHKDFIPIKEFTLDHLPEDLPYRVEYFDYLKSTADRVVHISALKVSPNRPRDYPLHKKRGCTEPRDGSGIVVSLFPCGLSGEGMVVLSDLIEKLLEFYKLSELVTNYCRPSPFLSQKWDPSLEMYSNKRILLRVAQLIEGWIDDNLLDSSRSQSCDKFTSDLISEIKICQEESKSLPGQFEGSSTSLNKYRKSIGLSVSEFCMALVRHTVQVDVTSKHLFEELFSLLEQPCPCSECHQNGYPKETWFAMIVKTAAHVVFDGHEADGTKVSLFYDGGNSQRVILDGVPAENTCHEPIEHEEKAKEDVSYFVCSLHDIDVAKRLVSSVEDAEGRLGHLAWPHTAAVISHPHGSTKHISIGEAFWSDDVNRIEYTASTCPGSSGGLVTKQLESFSRKLNSHSRAISRHRGSCGGSRYALWGAVSFLF